MLLLPVLAMSRRYMQSKSRRRDFSTKWKNFKIMTKSNVPLGRIETLTKLKNAFNGLGGVSFEEIGEVLGEVYVPALVRWAITYRGLQSCDAEDLTNKWLSNFLTRIRDGSFTYKPEKGRFRSFVSKCIRDEAVNYYRRNHRWNALDHAAKEQLAECIDQRMEHVDTREAVAIVRNQFLEDTDFAIFEQCLIGEKSIKEIAKARDVSVEAIYRARARFNKLIDEKKGELLALELRVFGEVV